MNPVTKLLLCLTGEIGVLVCIYLTIVYLIGGSFVAALLTFFGMFVCALVVVAIKMYCPSSGIPPAGQPERW
jgi:hypothetical protein